MKDLLKKMSGSLYWKLASTFILILILLSAVYLYIAQFTAEMYFQEANQQLNRDVAEKILSRYDLYSGGEFNKEEFEKVKEDVSVLNPSIELYILDPGGKIEEYYAPEKNIKVTNIPLEEIKEFLEDSTDNFHIGHDPKDPAVEKTFSAAAIYSGGEHMGFLYIVLEGEEYLNAYDFVFGSYILRLAVRSMSITLAAAFIISLIALHFITKNIQGITSVVKEFRNGNTSARIIFKGRGELKEFADTFNGMADKIEQNIEELKTMDNLRRELVANVSHDLRTPLAAVQGYLETLIIKFDDLSESERKRYMEIIHSGAERLKKLIEELFELSKLEAREKKPKPEPFSIAELLQDVYQKHKIIADAKGIELRLNFSYDLPYVYADISMIERVLQNLIENSVKFTSEGGIVEISLFRENEKIQVCVSDNGCGINKEEITSIFERHNRGSSYNITSKDGMGLGLAIVKKILEVHNTSISVNNNGDSGTSFSFHIPVYKSRS